jgi:hypothetical protein
MISKINHRRETLMATSEETLEHSWHLNLQLAQVKTGMILCNGIETAGLAQKPRVGALIFALSTLQLII